MKGKASARPLPVSDDPSVPTSPRERWEQLFGTRAPDRLASLVEQAVAWKEQILVHGDVSPAVRRDLVVIAGEVSALRNTPDQIAGAGQPRRSVVRQIAHHALDAVEQSAPCLGSRRKTPPLPPASSQLQIGTRLVKAYGGRNHVVEVTDQGMLYEGQLFASLSAVAKHITGTHWNGLLFFGLRKRKTYPAKAAG